MIHIKTTRAGLEFLEANSYPVERCDQSREHLLGEAVETVLGRGDMTLYFETTGRGTISVIVERLLMRGTRCGEGMSLDLKDLRAAIMEALDDFDGDGVDV